VPPQSSCHRRRLTRCRVITLMVAKCSSLGKCRGSQRSSLHICASMRFTLARRGTSGSRNLRSPNTANPCVITANSSRVRGVQSRNWESFERETTRDPVGSSPGSSSLLPCNRVLHWPPRLFLPLPSQLHLHQRQCLCRRSRRQWRERFFCSRLPSPCRGDTGWRHLHG